MILISVLHFGLVYVRRDNIIPEMSVTCYIYKEIIRTDKSLLIFESTRVFKRVFLNAVN